LMLSPKDTQELQLMVRWALSYKRGPIAIRYPRGGGEIVSETCAPIELGRSEILQYGDDLTLVAYGPMVAVAQAAARQLQTQHGVDATVVNARWAKPLDEETILSQAHRTRRIITLEDGVIAGGFGSAVLELLAARQVTDVAVRTLGIPDHFVEHGTIPILRGLNAMDQEGVIAAAADILGRPEITPSTPGEAAVAAGRV